MARSPRGEKVPWKNRLSKRKFRQFKRIPRHMGINNSSTNIYRTKQSLIRDIQLSPTIQARYLFASYWNLYRLIIGWLLSGEKYDTTILYLVHFRVIPATLFVPFSISFHLVCLFRHSHVLSVDLLSSLSPFNILFLACIRTIAAFIRAETPAFLDCILTICIYALVLFYVFVFGLNNIKSCGISA